MTNTPQLLFDVRAELGEGPFWNARTQTLHWLDILNKRVYAGADLLAQLDEFIGCAAFRRDGGLILALKNSIVDLKPDSVKPAILATLSEPANNRLNDGKCDPAGRFLAGSMDMNETDPTGALYSFDGKTVTKLLSGITISNGLTWSPDHRTFYYTDTPTRQVTAFDYDLSTGQIANPRPAVRVPDGLGWPDGMTSDMDGNLWIAMWGGAQVTKWDPHTGRLLEQIPMPALQPSSCIFGGADLNELYVTSARKGLSPEKLQAYPLSGGVFKIITEATGIPTFQFAG
ncbi:MAG: SMP-30/gluconolactonase/LRE family protein [Chloroflexi bacterium]|nr:SMP-30/gluconolactonase/LRE family protein [Chloroflexota bacterium]